MGFLLLGIDSFIACIAVGPIISRRWYAPFAALFGICDAGGFLLGSAFHWSVSDSVAQIATTSILVLLGFYWIGIAILAKATEAASSRSPRLMWILPFALSIDNITYGLAGDGTGSIFRQASEQLVSSTLLAGIGLAIGLGIARAIPAVRNHTQVANGVAGGALVLASGALFLWG
jgi:hypothetical protein